MIIKIEQERIGLWHAIVNERIVSTDKCRIGSIEKARGILKISWRNYRKLLVMEGQ